MSTDDQGGFEFREPPKRLSPYATLGEARRWVMAQEDVLCPCCGRRVKTYRRKLPLGDMRALASLYAIQMGSDMRSDGWPWVHIADLQGKSGGGDFAKFRYWGLIEAKENDDDPNVRDSGLWCITDKGIEFMRDERRIPTHVAVRLDECLGPASDERVNRSEACRYMEGFDFEALMQKWGGPTS